MNIEVIKRAEMCSYLLPDPGGEVLRTLLNEIRIERPVIAAALVVRKELNVLVQKRLGNRQPNTWGFPGGYLEKWENIQTGVLRELHEEAGLISVTSPKFWTIVEAMQPEENLHYITIIMISDWLAGEPQIMEPEKCAEWRWCDWETLPEPLMVGIEYLKAVNQNPINF